MHQHKANPQLPINLDKVFYQANTLWHTRDAGCGGTGIFLFQGFGDPARLLMGQTADAATMQNSSANYTLTSQSGSAFCFTSMMCRR